MALQAQERRKREQFRCKHRHSGITHPVCYLRQNEYVGYLDIEATGLNADFDIVISYSIKSSEGEQFGRVLTSKEVLDYDTRDRKLCQEFCQEVRKFDRLVVYYGSNHRFDIPFLRARCLKWNCDFPEYGEIFITDAYDIVRNKLKLSRNRLANVAQFFNIPSKQHPLSGDEWGKAKLGYPKGLAYVWEHNKEDTDTLKAVYEKLRSSVRLTRTSL